MNMGQKDWVLRHDVLTLLLVMLGSSCPRSA